MLNITKMQNNDWTKIFAHYVVLISFQKIKVNWNKKTLLSCNDTMIAQNVTHVFILPSVQVQAFGIERANFLKPFQFFSIILLSLKMVAHCINFLSEYSKCSRLETNLDYMAGIQKLYAVCSKNNIAVLLTWGLPLSCWNQNIL